MKQLLLANLKSVTAYVPKYMEIEWNRKELT